MNPEVRPGATPRFHVLGEYPFQEMCRDLFDMEESVHTCRVYGTRGQSQFGIDLLAYSETGNGIEVGQCKCYAEFSETGIREASDEFFDHWDRWASKNVDRFILFVACDFTRRQIQDEILKQTDRFKEHGITYEVWSAETIRNKLRAQPGIVANYLSPPELWLQVICGVMPAPYASDEMLPSRVSVLLDTALASEFEQLGDILSTDAEHHLESMRNALREGRKEEAVEWVKSLRADGTQWRILSPSAQAKVIRFEAGLLLDVSENLDQSKRLADEARNLAPEDNDSRLRALIASQETGFEDAITILDDQVDIDSINLKASFLLNLDRAEECAQLLTFDNPKFEPNADTFKLRAVSYLVKRDLASARVEIGKSLFLEPRSENIRFTFAVIDYLSALSPGATPDRAVPWPDPVDWALVKRDDESVSRLRNSADVFLEFAEKPGVEEENRLNLETWRLACLANDPERREQAAEYCEKVLKENPIHYRFLSWACARNFEFDLNQSMQSLANLVKVESASVPQILGLVSCHLISRDFDQILGILNQTKSVFESEHAEKIWTLWSAQIHALNGDSSAALSVIDGSQYSDELRYVRSMALRVEFEDTRDWNPLIEHLESCYFETGDPVFLYESCEFMALQENWDYVSNRATKLVEEIGTGEALRIGAIAFFNTNEFESCLQLIDDHRDLYAQGRIPAQLRRLRVLCQTAAGDVPKAIEDSEALAREEPTASNLFELAQIYFRVGNLSALVSISRDLRDKSDLSVEQAIWICQSVSLENPRLAQSFWRRAKNLGIPDDAVGKCVALGFQLDLESEMGDLYARMQALGQQEEAGIWTMTYDGIVTLVRQQRDRLMDLNSAYDKGSTPVHIISDELNHPLADLYHRVLNNNESSPDPYSQPYLFARHGGRPLVSGFPEVVPQWRLHLDITAVLLAEHLEILDEVEASYSPLSIPGDLIPTLVRMLEKLSAHQPSQLRACQQIADLAEQGKLQSVDNQITVSSDNETLVEELGAGWVSIFGLAQANNGFLVDFLPLSKIGETGPPSSLPDDGGRYLVNCRAIVDSLLQYGPLSQESFNQALRDLGSISGQYPSAPIPRPGSTLYCHANIPEVLATANLLGLACSQYQVHIESQELDRVRSVLQGHRRNEDLAVWVNGLIDRLNQGINQRTYQVLPIPRVGSAEGNGEIREGEASTCLRGLLGFETKPGDVLWFDDRYLNGFQNSGKAQIIGINELLKSLVSAGALDKNGYYERIGRLRAANVKYVPIQKEEILHLLEQASVHDGVVVETQALITLRRYLAACLLHGGNLQKPSSVEAMANQNGELAFVIGVNRAITDSLIALWAPNDQNDDSRQPKSNWIVDNLYIDFLGLFNVTSSPNSLEDDYHAVALSLAGLVVQAIELIAGDLKQQRTDCSDFFEWLQRRLLLGRFEADPQLIRVTTKLIKDSLVETRANIDGNEESEAAQFLLQRLHQQLPEDIRNELSRDDEFMGQIGLNFQSVLSISGLGFEPNQFWQAASEAINGSEAHLKTIGSVSEVTFRPYSDTEIRFIHPVNGEDQVVRNELLALLDESPLVRESVLENHPNWFDCPAPTRALAIAEIVSIDDPFRRIEAVNLSRKSSASLYYEGLFQAFSQTDRFERSDIRPTTAEALVQHLRIAPDIGVGSEFLAGLDTAAKTLIKEEGLEEAVSRVSGFPTALPNPIIETVYSLSDEDRLDLFKRLIDRTGSPISQLHLVHLMLRFADNQPVYLRLARRITKRLFSLRGTNEIEAFLGVLRWIYDDIGSWADARSWSAQVRLAISWAHANRIFAVFVSSGAPIPWLRSTFAGIRHQTSPEMFNPERENRFENSHPRRIERVQFLLSGLNYWLDGKSSALIDQNLSSAFAEQAFPEKDGQRVPDLALYGSPGLLENTLNSIFGVEFDGALEPLIGIEAATQFSQSSLKTLANQALDTLIQENNDSSAWFTLYAILGDLPLEGGLGEKLDLAIEGTDFVALFDSNPTLAGAALRLSSMQVRNLRDSESRQRIINGLIGVARSISRIESIDGPPAVGSEKKLSTLEEMGPAFLEVALNLSMATDNANSPAAEFADLVTQIIEVCEGMIPMTKPVILKLCEELPIAEAQLFWPLLLRIRTV